MSVYLCVCIECRILFKSFVLLQFSLQDKGGKIFLFVCLAHLPLSICLVSSSSWPVLSRLLLVASSPASSFPLPLFPLSPLPSSSSMSLQRCGFFGELLKNRSMFEAGLLIAQAYTFAILLQAGK